MIEERDFLKAKFLERNNLKNIEIFKIPADASFRSYERLTTDGKNFILMNSPPDKEDIKPFIKLSQFLIKNDISAPEIYDVDETNGFALLEDFGDDKFTTLLPHNNFDKELENILYTKAIDVLSLLHRVSSYPEISDYKDDHFIEEALLLTKWYLPALNGESTVKQELEDEYKEIWRGLLPLSRILPNSVILRDYHADNLMWLPERSHIKKVGVLDFQDALIGSQAYDIVSLLEDLRRDVSDELANRMVTYYLDSNTHISRKDFLVAYHILGAQRNCKIIGFCARKAMRDNNTNYLKMLPRMWHYIDKDLKHPLLLPLRKWFDKVIPYNIRSPRKG